MIGGFGGVACVVTFSSPFLGFVFFPFFFEVVDEVPPELEETTSDCRANDQPTIATATMPAATRVSVVMVIWGMVAGVCVCGLAVDVQGVDVCMYVCYGGSCLLRDEDATSLSIRISRGSTRPATRCWQP